MAFSVHILIPLLLSSFFSLIDALPAKPTGIAFTTTVTVVEVKERTVTVGYGPGLTISKNEPYPTKEPIYISTRRPPGYSETSEIFEISTIQETSIPCTTLSKGSTSTMTYSTNFSPLPPITYTPPESSTTINPSITISTRNSASFPSPTTSPLPPGPILDVLCSPAYEISAPFNDYVVPSVYKFCGYQEGQGTPFPDNPKEVSYEENFPAEDNPNLSLSLLAASTPEEYVISFTDCIDAYRALLDKCCTRDKEDGECVSLNKWGIVNGVGGKVVGEGGGLCKLLLSLFGEGSGGKSEG